MSDTLAGREREGKGSTTILTWRKGWMWKALLWRAVMERPWKAALAGSASRGRSCGPAPACCSTAAKRYGALQPIVLVMVTKAQ